jgi:hypothetical protein
MLVHQGALGRAGLEEQIQHTGNLGESDLRHAVFLGATVGLTSGMACGVVLWLIGIFPGDASSAVAFGALMGPLVGLLMTSIVGTGLVDWRLRRLAGSGLHQGEVLMTVDVGNREIADRVIDILQRHRAVVAEKSVA